MKITAIIIAKNAEDMIADCLDSVSFCDETLVIDDMSSDRTAELAKYKGAKVITHSFTSFAEKRNYGLQKAKHDWVFYIDTDERVSDELRESIKMCVEQFKKAYNATAYAVKRKNFYFGNHEWPTVERLERLFYKKSLQSWKGDLHETPVYEGKLEDLDGYLLHYTHRDLHSMLEKTNKWSEMEAHLRLAANHPRMTWWRFPRVMATAFFDSYVKQKGYKVGTVGLMESTFQAYSMFITYAKLWELQNATKSNTEKQK